MEFEIEEPFSPNSWESEWRSRILVTSRDAAQARRSVKALEIPESEEA